MFHMCFMVSYSVFPHSKKKMPSRGYKKDNVSNQTIRNRRYREKQNTQPTRVSQRQPQPRRFFDDSQPDSNEGNEFRENFEQNAGSYSEFLDDEMMGNNSDEQQENEEPFDSLDYDILQLETNANELPTFTCVEEILQFVALMCNLPHSAVDLLSRCLSQLLLKKKFIRKKLPLAATLLRTTRNAARQITKIFHHENPTEMIGRYAHIGLRKGIISVLNNFPEHFHPDEILLDFFIDGFPPHENSDHVKIMTAIMCRVVMKGIERNKCPIFLVGIYGGGEEPKTPAFLSQWVEEFNELFDNFLQYGDRILTVKFGMLIGDMIGRNWFLGTAGAMGLSSCIKCKARGENIEGTNKKQFPARIGVLRTDAEFRRFADGNFHRIVDPNELPLLNLKNFDFIKNVVHCSLHGILLGMMKRQLELTLSILPSPLKKKLLKFTAELFEKYSADFSRRGRYFKDWMRFKGHEYYDFLMHYGPLIYQFLADNEQEIAGQPFHGKLDKLRQANLLLHCSARILYSEELVKIPENIEKTKTWLAKYVLEIRSIFNDDGNTTPNGHQLLHFPDQCKIYGSLRNVEGSCFENHINRLAAMLRFRNRELEQYVCRASELEDLNRFMVPSTGYEIKNIEKNNKRKAKTILIDGRAIKSNDRDGFLLMEDGSFCCAKSFSVIHGKHMVEFIKYPGINKESFYTEPMNSSHLNYFLVRNFSNNRQAVIETALVSNIKYKLSCFVWDKNRNHLVFSAFSKLAHPPASNN